MRFCSTVFAVVGSVTPLVSAAELTADEIMQRVRSGECARELTLREYSVTRRYFVENEKGTRSAEATARIDFRSDRGKTYQILNESGSDFMFRRAIRKVLDGEVDTSKNGRADIRLTSENYTFQLLGVEEKDGRQCYIIDLHPKQKSKYLIDGRGWVDTTEFVLIRLEGRPAASLSFWVGKPLIVQTYQKVGDYWLLSTAKSIADCRFIGKAKMNIEASDFDFPGVPRVTVARGGSSTPSRPSID